MRFTYITALVFLPALVAAQPSTDAGALQRCVASEVEQRDFSGTVLVSHHGRIVAAAEQGRLAGADSAAIGRDTRFNLGSASKMFTAVAIGQLIDAGNLRLDQPVGEIIAGLNPEAAKVTIRQLLTHSSGLGDFFHPDNMAAMMKARTASDILSLIADDTPAFKPGSRFAYSNSGFALLGVVIERLSGQSYGQYLRERVFALAGMDHSGIDPRPLSTLAVGMTKGAMQAPGEGRLMLIGPDGKPMQPPGVTHNAKLFAAPGATVGYGSPAGGLFSTGEDMQRFATALIHDRLLSRRTTAIFTARQIESAPAADGRLARYYGFGFAISDEGGARWVGHNGGTLGANTEFAIQPEEEWVIAVLANRDPPMATAVMRRIKAFIADPKTLASCARSE